MHRLHSHATQTGRPDWSWNLDIDKYLNPFIPAPPWRWLPRPVSHFLGYRPNGTKPLGNVLVALWSLVGVFCGVAVIASVSRHVPSFSEHGASKIVASFGAAAVLEFAVIESPFAQPRNAILSQLFASIIGVGIGKLFALDPTAHDKYPELGGALACAITTAVMVLTNTVHPPAGATALLAVTQDFDVGWFLIPVMLLGCVLMQAVALFVNNIQRRFPVYWWTAQKLGPAKEEDVESGKKGECLPSASEDSLAQKPQIVIQRDGVFVPDNMLVTDEEREILERLCQRIP